MPRVSIRLFRMIRTAMALSICLLAVCEVARAQELTAAQKDAIKGNCRSDFLSFCTTVSRGGAEALQCLTDNVANLSPGCQQAVKALAPRASAPAVPAAAPAPAPAASSLAPTPTPPAAASSVSKTAPPVATPPVTPAAVPPAPKQAAPTAPLPPPAPPAVIVATPFQVLRLVRAECRAEYQAHCLDADIGGGGVLSCLQANMASLSPACSGAIAAMAR